MDLLRWRKVVDFRQDCRQVKAKQSFKGRAQKGVMLIVGPRKESKLEMIRMPIWKSAFPNRESLTCPNFDFPCQEINTRSDFLASLC